MDIIQMARDLGTAIQQDPRYKAYEAAKEKNDSNLELQKRIADFHALKADINAEQRKPDADRARIQKMNDDLRDLFMSINNDPDMVAFEAAREGMDAVLDSINFIITAAANGKDPQTCPDTPPEMCSCGAGGCAGCAGCG